MRKLILLFLLLAARTTLCVAQNTVNVNNIKEALQLPKGTPVYIRLTNALVAGGTDDYYVLRDNTGAITVEKIYDFYRNYEISNTITSGYCLGTISENEAFPLLEGGYIYAEGTEGYTGEPDFQNIDEDEYWDNVGNLVCLTGTDIICWDKRGCYLLEDSTITVKGKADICGIVFPTRDMKKRILLYDYFPHITKYYYDDGSDDFYWIDTKKKGMYMDDEGWEGIHIVRDFEAGKWYTLCLPIGYNFGKDATIAEFKSYENGVLNFQTVTYAYATKPYLIKFNKDKTDFISTVYKDIPHNGSRVNGGDYDFVGTLAPIQPSDGTIYLTANNTLRPLASGGTIKGFRAYFEPVGASPAQAKAMRFCVDGEDQGSVTGIDGIMIDPKSGNEKVYNMSGQYVGNSLDELPQGIYIVNGKKVVK